MLPTNIVTKWYLVLVILCGTFERTLSNLQLQQVEKEEVLWRIKDDAYQVKFPQLSTSQMFLILWI